MRRLRKEIHLFKRKSFQKAVSEINPFNANFTKWSNTFKRFVDELFKCVWPFLGLAIKGLTYVQMCFLVLGRTPSCERPDRKTFPFSPSLEHKNLSEHWVKYIDARTVFWKILVPEEPHVNYFFMQVSACPYTTQKETFNLFVPECNKSYQNLSENSTSFIRHRNN